MEIYICFGTDKSIKSRIICFVTKSAHSHSWVEYSSQVWKGRWVAHSTARGVIKEIQPQVRARYPIHKIYRCKMDLKEGLQAVREYVGTADYDFGVIWNGILLLFYRVLRWRKLYEFVMRNTAKISCSEFVALIFQQAKVPGAENIDPELTTTGMLETIASESSDFELIEQAPNPTS